MLRYYGLEYLRDMIRNHVAWAEELAALIREKQDFEIVTDPMLSLFSFRCPGDDDTQQTLVDKLNDDGRLYVTQTLYQGRKVIRFQVGQFETTRDDVIGAYDVIDEVYQQLASS